MTRHLIFRVNRQLLSFPLIFSVFFSIFRRQKLDITFWRSALSTKRDRTILCTNPISTEERIGTSGWTTPVTLYDTDTEPRYTPTAIVKENFSHLVLIPHQLLSLQKLILPISDEYSCGQSHPVKHLLGITYVDAGVKVFPSDLSSKGFGAPNTTVCSISRVTL